MKKARVATTAAQIDLAIARAKRRETFRPKVVTAQYRPSTDVVAIGLATGVEVLIPRRLLQGLESASPAQASKIEIVDFGSGLHWPKLNVDHFVPGLLDGVFGTRRWMAEMGRRGGAVRTKAKAKSSRLNGRKGGRPRKKRQNAA